MKRSLLIAFAAFVAVGAISAEAKDGGFEPLMSPGDLAVTPGVGYGFLWGAIDVSGGVEYMLGQFKIADTLPLTYGAAVKASYFGWHEGSYAGYDWKYSYLGAGAFGTLHFGLKSLSLPGNMAWLANVDSYIGVGAGFYSYSYPSWNSATSAYVQANEFRIGLRTTAGVSYFFTPNVALVTEGGYYGGWGGGLVGILIKL